jgi:hypothetical protein
MRVVHCGFQNFKFHSGEMHVIHSIYPRASETLLIQLYLVQQL